MNKRSSRPSLLHYVIINDGKGHVQVAVINVECDCVTQALTYHWGALTLAISSTEALLCLLFFFFLKRWYRESEDHCRSVEEEPTKPLATPIATQIKRVAIPLVGFIVRTGWTGRPHCTEWKLCSLRGTTIESTMLLTWECWLEFPSRYLITIVGFGVAWQFLVNQQTANLFQYVCTKLFLNFIKFLQYLAFITEKMQ